MGGWAVEALARLPALQQAGLLAVGVWWVVVVVLCCEWGGMISITTPVELCVYV